MSDEPRAVVYIGPSDDEAAAVRRILETAGIPTVAQVSVPADKEDEAIRVLEARMNAGRGLSEPEPEKEDAGDAPKCPNCEAEGAVPGSSCAECGFELGLQPRKLPPLVAEQATGARSFCPECREPLTFADGECPRCGEELEPLESGDRLCPELLHVLYRDTVGGIACKACRRAWLSAS